MATAAPGETLEQKVFGIYTATQEVIKASDEKLADGIDGADTLEAAIGALSTETLADLAKRTPLQALGPDSLKVIDAKNTWSVGSATLQLAKLARPLYIEAQNQALRELLEGMQITASIPEDGHRYSITTHPDKDLAPVPSPVTGVIHPANKTTYGHLVMSPLDAEPGSPWQWNVHLLDIHGAPQVDLAIEPIPQPVTTV